MSEGSDNAVPAGCGVGEVSEGEFVFGIHARMEETVLLSRLQEGTEVSESSEVSEGTEGMPGWSEEEVKEVWFRKKPVLVEARRWDDTGQYGATAIVDWIRTNRVFAAYGCDHPGDCPSSVGSAGHHIGIHTLEGVMRASPGDWIIRGVRGEFYPCKPDIFEMTYEPVRPGEPDWSDPGVRETFAKIDEFLADPGKEKR